MITRYYDANGRHYATEHGPLVELHPEAPGHIALWEPDPDEPGSRVVRFDTRYPTLYLSPSSWADSGDDQTGMSLPAVQINGDGRAPSDPDSAPPDGAEPITGDWDKKEPIINCRDAMLLAVGAGVVLAAAVFVTLLAAMGWIG